MVHARPSPMKSRANSETIEAIKNQRLVEYEQYVDEDGNVYDDEGNVSRRGRSFGRQYGGQTYTGTRPPWSGRSKYKSTRKTSYVGADSNADQIAAVEAAIAVKPNNFLTSILKQLKKGRGLSAKQKSIVKKIIVKNDAEAAKLFEGRRMKITKRQLRRIIKEERQTLLKEYSDYPSWLDLSDQVDDISEMLDMAADKYVTVPGCLVVRTKEMLLLMV